MGHTVPSLVGDKRVPSPPWPRTPLLCIFCSADTCVQLARFLSGDASLHRIRFGHAADELLCAGKGMQRKGNTCRRLHKTPHPTTPHHIVSFPLSLIQKFFTRQLRPPMRHRRQTQRVPAPAQKGLTPQHVLLCRPAGVQHNQRSLRRGGMGRHGWRAQHASGPVDLRQQLGDAVQLVWLAPSAGAQGKDRMDQMFASPPPRSTVHFERPAGGA